MIQLDEFNEHLKKGKAYKCNDVTKSSKSVNSHLNQLLQEGTIQKASHGRRYFSNTTKSLESLIVNLLIIAGITSGCSSDPITNAISKNQTLTQTSTAVPQTPTTKTDSINIPTDGNVYISGYVSSSQNSYSHAMLWKDGSPIALSGMTAPSVFRSTANADVYVTAFTDAASGNQYARYWNRASTTTLSNEAITNSMFVSGSDVYVAGNSFSGGLYWKNGLPNYLPITDSIGGIYLMSIFVSGDDVYTAGTVVSNKLNQYAAYWKNNEIHYLKTNPTMDPIVVRKENNISSTNSIIISNATSIFVSGNDVYVGGRNSGYWGGQMATVWKNGIPVTLDSANSYVNSVFISGSDFYAAGFNERGGAYWKNNVPVSVGSKSAVNSIYVSGSDVHLAGYVIQNGGMHAAYWKNGLLTVLEGNSDSQALSIVAPSLAQ